MRRDLICLCQVLKESKQPTSAAAATVMVVRQAKEQRRADARQRQLRRSGSRPRTGATAAEFVVLLPLLVVLCLCSVDFGRFAHVYIALGNAGRTGAEYGATHAYSPTTAASWKSRVEDAVRQDFTAIADVDPSQLVIQIEAASDAYGLHRATLTTAYPFQTVVAWPAIPQPLQLQRTIVFRRFR